MLPNQQAFRRRQLRGIVLALLALTGGCSRAVARTYALFGAFFPAWLLCAVIGVIGAILARFEPRRVYRRLQLRRLSLYEQDDEQVCA
jgi:hypothetical protein